MFAIKLTKENRSKILERIVAEGLEADFNYDLSETDWFDITRK